MHQQAEIVGFERTIDVVGHQISPATSIRSARRPSARPQVPRARARRKATSVQRCSSSGRTGSTAPVASAANVRLETGLRLTLARVVIGSPPNERLRFECAVARTDLGSAQSRSERRPVRAAKARSTLRAVRSGPRARRRDFRAFRRPSRDAPRECLSCDPRRRARRRERRFARDGCSPKSAAASVAASSTEGLPPHRRRCRGRDREVRRAAAWAMHRHAESRVR